MPEFAHVWPLALVPLVLLLGRRRSPPGPLAARALFHPEARLIAGLAGSRPARDPDWPVRIALIAALLALAGPRLTFESTPETRPGRNIVLAIDVSGSMRALTETMLDGEPASRLDLVRAVSKRLVRERPDDRFGIVTFADEAVVYLPLSDDNALAERLLDDLGPGLVGERTALGDAVALACRLLGTMAGRSRLLLIFSDGRNTAGTMSPTLARRLAEALDVRIYAIGVGRPGPALFPRGPAKRPLTAELAPDTATLSALAEGTGGRRFEADDLEGLESIMETIDREATDPLPRASETVADDRLVDGLLVLSLLALGVAVWRETRTEPR